MKDQAQFACILARKMKEGVLPTPLQEVHSVDEILCSEFVEVLGKGSLHRRYKGLCAYGAA